MDINEIRKRAQQANMTITDNQDFIRKCGI